MNIWQLKLPFYNKIPRTWHGCTEQPILRTSKYFWDIVLPSFQCACEWKSTIKYGVQLSRITYFWGIWVIIACLCFVYTFWNMVNYHQFHIKCYAVYSFFGNSPCFIHAWTTKTKYFFFFDITNNNSLDYGWYFKALQIIGKVNTLFRL